MTQTENTALATDYIRGVAKRVEELSLNHGHDQRKIMALLGYEVQPHGRLGVACRKIGESHWQSLPCFRSADDFELWVMKDPTLRLDAIDREPNGQWSVSYLEKGSNDYGYSDCLGAAMWAAFVRVRAGTIYGWPEEED